MKLESYYKSEDEKNFTEKEVNKITLATCLVESLMRVNDEYPHSHNDFCFDNCVNIFFDECCECGSNESSHDLCLECGSDQ